MFKKLLSALLALAVLPCAARATGAMDRSELRARWAAIESAQIETPYAETPDPSAFFPGALTQAAQENALDCLNLIRALAGLDAVSINPLYALRAQNGALLLSANDRLEHHPPQPEGMDASLYASGLDGTSMGNIARFNWMRPEILTEGVAYFARDDGDANLPVLGHRRWLLNPEMAETGFGLANAPGSASYVCMYAVDAGNADADWAYVAWPAAGCFPVELMRRELAWSVSFNEEIYDLDASEIAVTLREERSGAEFHFDAGSGAGDGFCALNREAYGAGPCLIFRPEIERAGIEEYVQNQRWTVRVSGLVRRDGGDAALEYACEMVSVYPQPVVNVEITPLEASLKPGEALQLSAAVVPGYADDLSIIWTSSDPSVATVDASGLATALSPGECSITAASANGRADACRLRVE